MKILLATNNPAKVARVRTQMSGRGFDFVTPADLGLEAVEVEEGSDLAENARRKASAYAGKTDVPVLGFDSAFVIPGEKLDPVKVKRNALGGRDERSVSQEEVARAMIEFYRAIARKRGGRVSASWEDAFALKLPDGTIREEHGRRPVTLTDAIREPINPHIPIRSLYVVEVTGKYAADQTSEEERLEMRPYREALERLLQAPILT